MSYSRILGTGSYLPSRIVTNDELAQRMDTSDEWIQKRTGIRQRHVASEEETTGSMASAAATQALEMAQIDKDAIDLVIVGTSTPEYNFPSTACVVQQNLGLAPSPAFDISAACSGFIYGLSVADDLIRVGRARHALVIGGDVMSRIVDWQDRNTCILFGDAAGAVVLGPSETPGIYGTQLYGDGRHSASLYVPSASASAGKDRQRPYIHMQGREVFRFAVSTLGQMMADMLSRYELSSDELRWLIPHQANIRIIQAMARRIDLDMDRVIVNVAQCSNTSAASVPLALDQGVRDGRIQRGHNLLLEAFGAGFTWGAALVKF